jgi:putative phage-type endonuclease
MQRNNYITASTSAACAGLMGKVARTNMLKEKVSFGRDKTFFGNAFTKKGNVFEPVTNMIYSYKTSKTIHAFALIPSDHPDWSFMGASTDGVTNVLDNIEIKTLARRAIGKVKREYHHQMQHQMFCLGLETTDFIEAKYDEYSTFEEWNDAKEGSTLSGIIVEIKKGEYVYSPIEEPDPVRWAREFDGGCIYWVMTDYQCVTVKRDPTWIVTMGPLLKSFWEEVLYLRTHQEEFEKLNKNINLVQCLV